MQYCNKCGKDKEETDFYKFKNGEIRKPCIDCMRKLEANRYAISTGKEPIYEFEGVKRSMNKIWPIGVSINPEEKKHIQSVYEKFRIPHSRRVLELMREDVKKLENKSDVLEEVDE